MKILHRESISGTIPQPDLHCEHGSWNRARPIGYRITLVRLDSNRAVRYETFCRGLARGNDGLGPPVDVLVMPDGALLVSDDRAGAIYRIHYRKPRLAIMGIGNWETGY